MMFGNYYGMYPPAQGQLEQYKQPYMQQSMQQSFTQDNTRITQGTDERIWVNGINQANDYLIAPNGFARLWDSTAPVFYEKRADASGRPYIESFEYKRRNVQEQILTHEQTNDYMAKFTALEERIKALEEEMKNEQSNDDDK